MLHSNMKGNAMTTIDIPTIERRARALRAQEIRRLHGLFGQRLALCASLFGASLLSLLQGVGKTLRPLFSWNPQHRRHC